MIKYLMAMSLLFVTACSSYNGQPTNLLPTEDAEFRPADAADLASTAGFLLTGNGVELNPVLADMSTGQTIAGVFGLKVAARWMINNAGATEDQKDDLHTLLDAIGYGATVNNIPLLFSNTAAPVAGVLFGLGYLAYNLDQVDAE